MFAFALNHGRVGGRSMVACLVESAISVYSGRWERSAHCVSIVFRGAVFAIKIKVFT